MVCVRARILEEGNNWSLLGKSLVARISQVFVERGDSPYWHVSEAAFKCFLKKKIQVEKHIDIRLLGLYLNQD